MPTHACPYCSAVPTTEQGLRSHLGQSPLCREKQFNAYLLESDGESDAAGADDSDSVASGDAEMTAPDEYTGADSNLEDEEGDDRDEPETYLDPPPNEMPLPSSNSTVPEPPAANPRKRPRATVEEVEDEDARWVQDFPDDMEAGVPLGTCQTYFEKLREQQKEGGHAPWYPFESEDEWELARWLMTSGLSQKKMDEYLKLKSVREGIDPSFKDNRTFLKFVDSLPEGPKWFCFPYKLVGDELDADGKPKEEIVEMWHRDPVEIVRELLANPSFTKQGYKPIRVFKRFEDGHYSNQEFTEMWTADWWWKIQELLPEGATVAPIIISSDKTQLTRFSGDKEAWPPLKEAGRDGVQMDCADGFVRNMFLILSAYIADYPEPCLVACCRENSCPRCLVHPKQRGEPVTSTFRDPDETLHVLSDQSKGEFPVKFVEQNLRPIKSVLLHNGAFGDHIVKWATEATAGKGEEVDNRFRAMPPHPTVRHFKKGISLTSQWTGNERKNMEKVFLGVLAKATDPAVQRAVRGVLDFIYYAHFETQCDDSLAKLDAAWTTFHANKAIFIDLNIRSHFNINKLHKLKHYVDSIRSRGTTDGFNTENTERLHIDFAKAAYKATNKNGYTRQMTVWLRRQEAIYRFGTYLQWAIPGYKADAQSASDDDEDDEADIGLSASASEPPKTPDEPDSDDDEAELEDRDTAEPSTPVYRVAKKPAFPHLTAATISTEFFAPDFLINLDRFLESKSIIPRVEPSNDSNFPVYKRLSFPLPKIPEVTSHDVIDTIPLRMTPKGVKAAKAGQFGTILVRTEKAGADRVPTDGLSVARIRVIFRLPEDHGNYPEPLAYVDWYKPLKTPVPDIGMHEISLSSRNHRQNSSIIPISHIFRSCHLIPVFGRAINPTWTSDHVLDQCKLFYLNPYLRHHDFYLFQRLTSSRMLVFGTWGGLAGDSL
ncbi:hypothetical protein B0H11DRAFT_2159912 [Mycena galericulata]|nr:hypothetical protein B0H11DRAFT_2159912 [Mycena galericulata]